MPSKTTLVHILTPIATAASAALTGWVAKHAPGVQLPTSDVTALAVLGGVSGLSACLAWLQKQHGVQKVEQLAEGLAEKVAVAVRNDPAAAVAQAELVHTLEEHKAQILDGVAKAVKLPPSAEEVAQKILDQAVSAKVASAGVPPARVVGVVQPPVNS